MALTTYQEINAYVYGQPGVPAAATPRDTLLGQIRPAAVSDALDIVSEAADTPNHANRVALATRIARDPTVAEQMLAAFLTASNAQMWAYVRQGTVLADSDVKSYLAAVWNAIAGV